MFHAQMQVPYVWLLFYTPCPFVCSGFIRLCFCMLTVHYVHADAELLIMGMNSN